MRKSLTVLGSIILISFILLTVLEFGAYAARKANAWQIIKSKHRDFGVPESALIGDVTEEYILVDFQPHSRLGYLHEDYLGTYITISDGKRKTFNPCASEESITIWFFGGSTAFGMASPDNETIPSQLSRMLCDGGMSVEITNMGVGAYTSTQERDRFLLELEHSPSPEIVIFYNGYNDVYLSHYYREAGVLFNPFTRTKGSKETMYPPKGLRDTNTWKVYSSLSERLGKRPLTSGEEANLQKGIIQVYVDNMREAEQIALKNDVKPYFFFQPTIFSKEKLTILEEEYLKEELKYLRTSVDYSGISNRIENKLENSTFHNMVNIFDSEPSTIFIDSNHKGRKGKEIEAAHIADIILTTEQVIPSD